MTSAEDIYILIFSMSESWLQVAHLVGFQRIGQTLGSLVSNLISMQGQYCQSLQKKGRMAVILAE